MTAYSSVRLISFKCGILYLSNYCTHQHLYLGELKLPVICRNSLNERQFCSMAWHQTAPMGTFRRPPPSCSHEPATIE